MTNNIYNNINYIFEKPELKGMIHQSLLSSVQPLPRRGAEIVREKYEPVANNNNYYRAALWELYVFISFRLSLFIYLFAPFAPPPPTPSRTML